MNGGLPFILFDQTFMTAAEIILRDARQLRGEAAKFRRLPKVMMPRKRDATAQADLATHRAHGDQPRNGKTAGAYRRPERIRLARVSTLPRHKKFPAKPRPLDGESEMLSALRRNKTTSC